MPRATASKAKAKPKAKASTLKPGPKTKAKAKAKQLPKPRAAPKQKAAPKPSAKANAFPNPFAFPPDRDQMSVSSFFRVKNEGAKSEPQEHPPSVIGEVAQPVGVAENHPDQIEPAEEPMPPKEEGDGDDGDEALSLTEAIERIPLSPEGQVDDGSNTMVDEAGGGGNTMTMATEVITPSRPNESNEEMDLDPSHQSTASTGENAHGSTSNVPVTCAPDPDPSTSLPASTVGDAPANPEELPAAAGAISSDVDTEQAAVTGATDSAHVESPKLEPSDLSHPKYASSLLKGREISLKNMAAYVRFKLCTEKLDLHTWHRLMDNLVEDTHEEEFMTLIDQCFAHPQLEAYKMDTIASMGVDPDWEFGDPTGDQLCDLQDFLRWLVTEEDVNRPDYQIPSADVAASVSPSSNVHIDSTVPPSRVSQPEEELKEPTLHLSSVSQSKDVHMDHMDSMVRQSEDESPEPALSSASVFRSEDVPMECTVPNESAPLSLPLSVSQSRDSVDDDQSKDEIEAHGYVSETLFASVSPLLVS